MALSRSKKQEFVSEMKEMIDAKPNLVFTDFSGMPVTLVQEFRRKLREEGATYKVVKKSLFAKTLTKMGVREDMTANLPGSLGVVFSEDPVAGAKVSYDFAKAQKKFEVLGAMLDLKYVSADSVESLAKLPSKEVLQGQVVGTIAAPISGFLNVLNGPSRGLVNVLNAYKDTKSA